MKNPRVYDVAPRSLHQRSSRKGTFLVEAMLTASLLASLSIITFKLVQSSRERSVVQNLIVTRDSITKRLSSYSQDPEVIARSARVLNQGVSANASVAMVQRCLLDLAPSSMGGIPNDCIVKQSTGITSSLEYVSYPFAIADPMDQASSPRILSGPVGSPVYYSTNGQLCEGLSHATQECPFLAESTIEFDCGGNEMDAGGKCIDGKPAAQAQVKFNVTVANGGNLGSLPRAAQNLRATAGSSDFPTALVGMESRIPSCNAVPANQQARFTGLCSGLPQCSAGAVVGCCKGSNQMAIVVTGSGGAATATSCRCL